MARGGSGAKPPLRVPGLPIRDCAGSCNSSVQMCTRVNAIDVTAKAIFERLYLVLGRGTFGPSFNCPCASTPPTAQSVANSRFSCLFVQKFHPRGPSFFGQHDSRSNLSESQYPPSACRTPKSKSFRSYVVRHGETWALDRDGFLIEAFFLDCFSKGISPCEPVPSLP